VADYRASAGIDIEHDKADRAAGRVLAMPVTVIQQDWGAALGYAAAARWRSWAPDLVHHTVDSGHYLAEEAPEPITALLRQLLARLQRAAPAVRQPCRTAHAMRTEVSRTSARVAPFEDIFRSA